MATMQAVGFPTYEADTGLDIDDKSSDDERQDDEPDNPITIVSCATGTYCRNGKILLFIYYWWQSPS